MLNFKFGAGGIWTHVHLSQKKYFFYYLKKQTKRSLQNYCVSFIVSNQLPKWVNIKVDVSKTYAKASFELKDKMLFATIL